MQWKYELCQNSKSNKRNRKIHKYLTKKFKGNEPQTLYYITWKLHNLKTINLKNILIRKNGISYNEKK